MRQTQVSPLFPNLRHVSDGKVETGLERGKLGHRDDEQWKWKGWSLEVSPGQRIFKEVSPLQFKDPKRLALLSPFHTPHFLIA